MKDVSEIIKPHISVVSKKGTRLYSFSLTNEEARRAGEKLQDFFLTSQPTKITQCGNEYTIFYEQTLKNRGVLLELKLVDGLYQGKKLILNYPGYVYSEPIEAGQILNVINLEAGSKLQHHLSTIIPTTIREQTDKFSQAFSRWFFREK